jgi:hypothetical protein
MITLSVLAVQVPLEMVQRNVFAPTPSPVTVDAGLNALVMVPAPLIIVQAPTPVAGAFPARVTEVTQAL